MIQRYTPKPKRTRRQEGIDFNTEETSYVPKRSLTVQSNKEIFQILTLHCKFIANLKLHCNFIAILNLHCKLWTELIAIPPCGTDISAIENIKKVLTTNDTENCYKHSLWSYRCCKVLNRVINMGSRIVNRRFSHATDSRAYNHYVIHSKSAKFLQQKRQPMQLSNFDFSV